MIPTFSLTSHKSSKRPRFHSTLNMYDGFPACFCCLCTSCRINAKCSQEAKTSKIIRSIFCHISNVHIVWLSFIPIDKFWWTQWFYPYDGLRLNLYWWSELRHPCDIWQNMLTWCEYIYICALLPFLSKHMQRFTLITTCTCSTKFIYNLIIYVCQSVRLHWFINFHPINCLAVIFTWHLKKKEEVSLMPLCVHLNELQLSVELFF